MFAVCQNFVNSFGMIVTLLLAFLGFKTNQLGMSCSIILTFVTGLRQTNELHSLSLPLPLFSLPLTFR